jgi:outer membrane protein assembly factor BamB
VPVIPAESYTKLGYRLGWNAYASLYTRDNAIQSIDFLGDSVIVQDDASVVTSMNAETGAYKWSTLVADGYNKFYGNYFASGHIISLSQSDAFILDPESGVLITRQKLGHIASTKAVRVGDLLVYGTRRGELVGHLTTTGITSWASRLSGPIESDPVLLSNGNAVAVSETGDVAIINAASGLSDGRTQLIAGAVASPAVSDRAVFVAGLDQSLWAKAANGGETLWRLRTDAQLTSSPTYHAGKVYQLVPGTGVVCVDAVSGKLAWTSTSATGRVIAAIGDKLLTYNGKEATTIDARNGELVERVALPGVKMLVPDRFANGNLYAIDAGGKVTKLTPR